MRPVSIEVSAVIEAPIAVVWEELARVDKHTDWMSDATSLEFLTPQQRGVGTRIAVFSRLGPIRVRDVIEFVAWEPPRRMAVEHQGLVGGHGEFVLVGLNDEDTSVTWRERLEFPWFLGGLVSAWIVQPALRRIWTGNLRRFAVRFPR